MSVRNLSALYEHILTSLGFIISTDGLVSATTAEGAVVPRTINNKRLFVPTETALRAYTAPNVKDNYIGFHPLSESILRAQSPVIKWMRQALTNRLQAVMAEQMIVLSEIAADTTRHKSLSPKATEFLSHVPEIDVKTAEIVMKIIGGMDGDKYKLVNIYLKQGGSFNGKSCRRAAVVTFPFLKEFENTDQTIFGVNIPRKKDLKLIEKIFRWMIPNADDINAYSVGSESDVAPYFHALMNAYVKVASRLNEITRLFKKQVDADELHIDIDWATEVVDLLPYRENLPSLPGNDGELTDDSAASAAVAKTIQTQQPMATSSPAPIQPLVPQNPFLPVPGTKTSPYDNIPLLGADGPAAEAANRNNPAKRDDSGMDLERTVMARSMGYAVTPPPGTPLGFGAPAPVAAGPYPWSTPGVQTMVGNGMQMGGMMPGMMPGMMQGGMTMPGMGGFVQPMVQNNPFNQPVNTLQPGMVTSI